MTRTTPPRAMASAPRIRDLPDIQPFRPEFRTVLTEIQRSTLGGGWETVAVAENADWAGTICSALTWLESSPAVFSETA